MNSRIRLIGIFIGFCSVSALSLLADDISRFSQKLPLRGEILNESAESVTIQVTQGNERKNVTVPLNDIQTVNYGGPGGILLRQVRTLENAGELEKAKGYLDKGAESKNFDKTALEFAAVRIQAKMALRDRDGLEEAIKAVSQFVAANSQTRHFYDSVRLSGQLKLANGDHPGAVGEFQRLGQAPWPSYQLEAVTWEGRGLLQSEDYERAIAKFDEVLAKAGEGDGQSARRQEATLYKAECLKNLKKYAEAEKMLLEVIEKTPSDEAEIQATARNNLGDILRDAGKAKDALIAYLYVDLIYKNAREQHPRALYHLTSLWQQNGNPSEAEEARKRLERDYPKSKWTEMLQE